MKSQTVSLFVIAFLLALLMTACSSASQASQPPEPAPVVEPQAGSHPPVILRVDNKVEVIEGFEVDCADIYFTDPDGDTVAVTYREVSTSLSYLVTLSDDPFEASIEEQKGEWQHQEHEANARSNESVSPNVRYMMVYQKFS